MTAVPLEGSLRLARKIVRASRQGALLARARGHLGRTLRDPISVAIAYARLPAADRALDVDDGFRDHRADPRHGRADPDHLARIVAAYRKSVRDAASSPPAFAVRGKWQEWIANNYGALQAALDADDRSVLARLLENYSREDFATGLGAGHMEYVRYRDHALGRMYVKTVWTRYRDLLTATGCDLSTVRSPFVGNPAGIRLNGDVVKINTFRHMHFAREILALVRDRPSPTIVEIGGGDGTQAYHALRLAEQPLRYLSFDIPEVSVLSAFQLLSALPDKKVVLYGEPGADELDRGTFDAAVLPHYVAARLPPRSFDLLFNACSLAEMDGASSRAYLDLVETGCRRWFLHVNHESRFEYRAPDGSISRSLIGSELVPGPHFRRVYKKARGFQLPEDRVFPAFEYLYERIEDRRG